MSDNLKDIEQIKNITFNGVASKSGTKQTSMNQYFGDVHFTPDFVILRSVTLSTSVATLNAIFYVWSDLINDYITSFTGVTNNSVTFNPNTVFKIQKPLDNMRCQLLRLNNDGTITEISTMTGDWYLSLNFDLVKLKKYDNFKNTTK